VPQFGQQKSILYSERGRMTQGERIPMPDEMIDLSARQMAKAARAIEQIVVSVAAAPSQEVAL
jgi:hypothetical protein